MHVVPAVIVLLLTIPCGLAQDVPVKITRGITPPKLIKRIAPEYSRTARDAKIQGLVIMSGVVNGKGRAQDLRVERTLDPELDANAIEAVRKWEFQAATKAGVPVSVYVTLEVNFRLE